jgi:CubicO group peptidase (beta-lactamase class C family)
MNKIYLAIILFLVLAFQPDISAQLSEDKIRKIDSLFISWNQPNHPGGTVGIMKEGKIIFSKAYGLASLE